MERRAIHHRPIHHRRGVALVLVVAVLATAAILGYALLSVNSLQAELSSNLAHSAGAEYAAESGARSAMYYLQLPSSAPSTWTSTGGYELYASAIGLNDGTTASFDVNAVDGSARNIYTIQSTGRSTTGSAYTHTVTAGVTVTRVAIPGAGIFGGNITIPKNATFSYGSTSGAVAIQANGSVTKSNGSTVSGTIVQSPLSSTAWTAPTAATVNYYGVGMSSPNYLAYDGVTLGTAQLISGSSISTLSIPLAASSNPGAVYYHNGNLTISGIFLLNGTLIVRGGTLTISSTATITPKTGYPALVCESGVTISGQNVVSTSNGVVFIGGNYTWTGTSNSGSKFAVSGALVMPSGSTIAATNNGSFSVTYASSKVIVPDLTTFKQPGTSIKVNSWSQ